MAHPFIARASLPWDPGERACSLESCDSVHFDHNDGGDIEIGRCSNDVRLRFPPQIQQRRSGWIQMSEEKRWAVDGTQGQMTHSGRQSVADKGAAAG